MRTSSITTYDTGRQPLVVDAHIDDPLFTTFDWVSVSKKK